MTLSSKRILLIIGGGIAAYKSLDLIRRLRERGAAVRVVMTSAAQEFVTTLSVGALSADRPFATRLLDSGPDRVTLLHDRIKLRRDGRWTEDPVEPGEWAAALHRWFGMTP